MQKTGRPERKRRIKRRVMVRYGVDKADRTAFTKNLSEAGLCVKTNTVFAPGKTLQVDICFPDRTFSVWARVVWAKKVPPQLAHVLDCGMGMSFIQPPHDWLAYYERWSEGK